jgi:hypothetical protein
MPKTKGNRKRNRKRTYKQKGCSKKKRGGGCGCGGVLQGGGAGMTPLHPSTIDSSHTMKYISNDGLLQQANQYPLNQYTAGDLQTGSGFVTNEGGNGAINMQLQRANQFQSGGNRRRTRRSIGKGHKPSCGCKKCNQKKRGGNFLLQGAENFLRVQANTIGNVYNGFVGKPMNISPLPYQDQLTRTPNYLSRAV